MTDDEHKINIGVSTRFLEAESDTDSGRYVFAYTITIKNTGKIGARLISRHWIITDSNEKIQEVRGDGVVGEQPYLNPGDSFCYTSGTLIETPVGTMRGSYQMIAEDGNTFDTEISEFTLAAPRVLH